jgi:tetratricopeptide (TPR) repeat protein
MNLRELLPKTKISEETMAALEPVFEGEILYKEGRYLEAEARYRAGLENFPVGTGGRFLIYNKLGILYEKLEKFSQAREVYEIAVKEGTSTPFTFQRLALLYLNARRFEEARRHCDLGIKVLKKAHTNFFQEMYFWLIFQKLKRSIKRCQSQAP